VPSVSCSDCHGHSDRHSRACALVDAGVWFSTRIIVAGNAASRQEAEEVMAKSDLMKWDVLQGISHNVGYSSAEQKRRAINEDFRRIALGQEGAEEGWHMGAPDFRVGGRIFATLASQRTGYGRLMLTPEQQAEFVEEQPEVFVPISGGRMGMTHIRLADTSEDVLAGALRAAWRLGIEKNASTSRKKRASARRIIGKFSARMREHVNSEDRNNTAR
jgi:YjbR